MLDKKQVKNLKERGFRIHVRHARRFSDYPNLMLSRREYQSISRKKTCSTALPRGGYTFVTLVGPFGRKTSGFSICDNADNFSRRFGFYRALSRAVERYEHGAINGEYT